MPICDGCARDVDASHIRQRIERLEFATRFRPVHIQVLLLDAAPPQRIEDYFYHLADDGSALSPLSVQYQEELFKFAGMTPSTTASKESSLADFQRRGFFLAYTAECPVEGDGNSADAIRDLSGTVVKRLQYSYRPKKIALLFQPNKAMLGALEQGGFSYRLLLEKSQPI